MSTERVHRTLRENLCVMMAERGLSQRGLSRMAELDETAVKQILSGRSRSPRLETVARLAAALEISIAGLIGDRKRDGELYDTVLDALAVFRQFGLMRIDEEEARAVAAAMAETLTSVDGERGAHSEHVASVARNIVNVRRFHAKDRDHPADSPFEAQAVQASGSRG
jgi:transcriptional regulator with XRE-family HTH domain